MHLANAGSQAIPAFTGPHAFLSNAYEDPVAFEAWGEPHLALTVDHAFQALKAGTQEEFLKVLASPTAQAAWELGCQIELRGDWNDVKIEIMEDLVGRKFEEPGLAGRLLETGAVPLVAGNDWHDGYWGYCRCSGCAGPGANVLGVVLMLVREEMR